MTTLVRAALFVVALATVFAAAFGVGKAYDDGDPAPAAEREAGFDLRLLDAPVASAARTTVRFVIEDGDGEVVTDFDVRHEKLLHLIAVDTGFTGYQHLHPTMASDGTWSTPMRITTGRTELYADFRPVGGEDVVARTRFDVPGPLGSPVFSRSRTQQVDGYQVTVVGDLAAGGDSGLRFRILRDGLPVSDLESYLGAYGHLVMLRKPDGEYLHVHPEDGPAGPEIGFAASVPTAARYHLYLDFKHGGTVHTAMFVLDAADAGDSGTDDGHGHEDGHEDGGHGDH